MKGIKKTKWIVLKSGIIIYALPETDTKPHADINCPCKPQIRWYGDNMVVVHNSFEVEDYLDNIINKL